MTKVYLFAFLLAVSIGTFSQVINETDSIAGRIVNNQLSSKIAIKTLTQEFLFYDDKNFTFLYFPYNKNTLIKPIDMRNDDYYFVPYRFSDFYTDGQHFMTSEKMLFPAYHETIGKNSLLLIKKRK